jgi:hypothetical protein
MTEGTKRIGFIATVVGAIGAIVYLLRGESKPSAVIATNPSPWGAAPLPALPGIAGYSAVPDSPISGSGTPGTPGAPGTGGGQPGDTVSTVPASTPGGTPPLETINNYYTSTFTGATEVPSGLVSNLPPDSDLTKYLMGMAPGPLPFGGGGGGCGCKGGNGGCDCGGGKCGGKCPNVQAPFNFPDGATACASMTPGSLIASMNQCSPGFAQRDAGNVSSNLFIAAIDTPPDWTELYQQIAVARSVAAPLPVPGIAAPPSRWGAA